MRFNTNMGKNCFKIQINYISNTPWCTEKKRRRRSKTSFHFFNVRFIGLVKCRSTKGNLKYLGNQNLTPKYQWIWTIIMLTFQIH